MRASFSETHITPAGRTSPSACLKNNPQGAFFSRNLLITGHRDEYRETVGIFLCQPTLRPAENQFLMVPLEKVRKMKPQAQRLLGYGLCEPGVGFMKYQDPMRVLFGVEDEETVDF